MSDAAEVLLPRHGHYFEVGLLLFVFAALAVLSAYAVYDLILGGAQALGLFALLVLIWPMLLALRTRPGRYAVIDMPRNEISAPSMFRRSRWRMVPASSVTSYTSIRSIAERRRIIGLILETESGRRYKYYDRKTPGCVDQILSFLLRNRVQERLPERVRLG